MSSVPDAQPLVLAPPAALKRSGGRVASLLLRVVVAAILGFAGVLGLAVSAPRILGYGVFTELSGSMEPTLAVGDVVVDVPLAPRDARVGDVITFRSADNPTRLLTHRVVHMQASGDTVSFVTKGDANTGTEHWSIASDGVLGRVSYRVPKAGYVTNRLGSRFGRLALIVIPALLLGLYELKRIWRPAHP